MQPGEQLHVRKRGVLGHPWGVSGRSRRCINGVSGGGDAQAASFSVGWTVPLQGKVLSLSDYYPATVSFAAVAA